MTIGTLYDIIKRILPTFVAENEKERDELKSAAHARLPEERISHYQAGVLLYFELLGECDEMLAKYLKSGADKGLAEGARAEGEDRALFRPIGQRIFADVITDIAAARGRTTARDQAKVLPKTLSETPFVHVIWDDDEHKIIPAGRSLATQVLKYMFGLKVRNLDKVRGDYVAATPDEISDLPSKLVE